MRTDVTLLRGALRGLLRVAPTELAAAVRAALARDDDYQAAGKPVCDWEDLAAREQLVDALFWDGYWAWVPWVAASSAPGVRGPMAAERGQHHGAAR